MFDFKRKNIYKISSLDELYKIISSNNYEKEITNYDKPAYFFRGQSDYSWTLVPGINRYKNKKEWKELSELKIEGDNLFSYIAQCQHEGKKTRFLDFTTSIDIVLYFACTGNPKIDAAIYIIQYTPRKSSWCDVDIISGLVLLEEEKTVSDFSEELLNNYHNIKEKYLSSEELSMNIMSWLDHGFMVLPEKEVYEGNKKNNPNLYNQKGAFYICGNKTKKQISSQDRMLTRAGNNVIRPSVSNVPLWIENLGCDCKVIVPSKLKEETLKQLKEKGIDESYVFPNKK